MAATDTPRRAAEKPKSRRGFDSERLILEAKRSSGSVAALLGLIALAVISIAIILSNIGISLPWQSTYSRQIALDNAKGIVAGEQDVRLAGVTVGRITKIQLENGRPVATISMSPKYGPLYNDAKLQLKPDTPLDDMYLDIISRGKPSSGALAANAILPAQRTQIPVDVSSVLDIFQTNTRDQVKQTIDTLGKALGPEGPQFEQTLVDLAPFLNAAKQLTTQTALRQTETRQLVHNFQLVSNALAQRDTEVRQLVANGASSLSELGTNESSVQAVINQLPGTMSQLESTFATLRATEDHLDPAFVALGPVAEALPTGLKSLTTFSNRARPAFVKLDRPLPVLNDLMRQLSPTASALNRSFASLRPVPGQLNTLTQLVVPCEPALADFFQNTLSIGAFSTPLSVVLRGETVVGASSSGTVQDQAKPASCAPAS